MRKGVLWVVGLFKKITSIFTIKKEIHIRGEYVLQEKYGTQKKAEAFYKKQMLDHLNDEMMQFASKQEIAIISTSDAEGNCDTSFRGGSPGFIRILDEKTLIYPEYMGNGVLASLGNMYENPHIGLLLIDFFESQVGLHINGSVEVLENDMLSSYLSISKEEQQKWIEKENSKCKWWVKVTVDEAYIHCSKHIPYLQKVEGFNENKATGNFFINKEKSIEIKEIPMISEEVEVTQEKKQNKVKS